ncbi:hypothetical protein HDU96_010674 [Phlyctochytrium bullatum]|nr:hypothetical protein HDU96_010674 [Phlyctochytrium bullatum]
MSHNHPPPPTTPRTHYGDMTPGGPLGQLATNLLHSLLPSSTPTTLLPLSAGLLTLLAGSVWVARWLISPSSSSHLTSVGGVPRVGDLIRRHSIAAPAGDTDDADAVAELRKLQDEAERERKRILLDDAFWPPGLANLGNTCFMNSVLQAMVALPALHAYVRDRCYFYYSPLVPVPLSDDTSEKPPLRVTEAMLDLCVALNDTRRTRRTLKPHGLIAALAAAKPGNRRLMCYEQQDAHELLQLITSTLTEEEVPGVPAAWSVLDLRVVRAEAPDGRVALMGKRRGEGEGGRREGVTVVRAGGVGVRPFRAGVGRNPFTGLLHNTMTCTQCGYTSSVRHDTFDNISLPVPVKSQVTIEDLLHAYVLPESIHEYVCDKCSYVATARKLDAEVARARKELEVLRQVLKTGAGAKVAGKVLDVEGVREEVGRREREVERREEVLKEVVFKARFDVEAKLPEGVPKQKVVSPLSRKQVLIAAPPTCLCLHMQRSVYLPSGHVMKNNCRVLFGELLDIAPFCTYGTAAGPGGLGLVDRVLQMQMEAKTAAASVGQNGTDDSSDAPPPLEETDDVQEAQSAAAPPKPAAAPKPTPAKKKKKKTGGVVGGSPSATVPRPPLVSSDSSCAGDSGGETTTVAADNDSDPDDAVQLDEVSGVAPAVRRLRSLQDLQSERTLLENLKDATGTGVQRFPYLYRLHAVVLHYGSHDSGHFVTYRRVPHPASREAEAFTLRSPMEGVLGVPPPPAPAAESEATPSQEDTDATAGLRKRRKTSGKEDGDAAEELKPKAPPQTAAAKRRAKAKKKGLSGGFDGGNRDARWFRISDDRVDLVQDLEEVYGHGAVYVYMLFYERVERV